jgi:hypothetical protein
MITQLEIQSWAVLLCDLTFALFALPMGRQSQLKTVPYSRRGSLLRLTASRAHSRCGILQVRVHLRRCGPELGFAVFEISAGAR